MREESKRKREEKHCEREKKLPRKKNERISLFLNLKEKKKNISSSQPQRVQQLDVVPHPRQRVRRDHPARRRGGHADPGRAAVPDPQQARQRRLRPRERGVRGGDPRAVGAPAAVEEALVGPRRRGQGDDGALPGVWDDALDAFLSFFCRGGRGGEREVFQREGGEFPFFFRSKKRRRKKKRKDTEKERDPPNYSPRAPASSPP